ncbi:hypothetical protein TRIATDRAFT_320006 [Trichoderma atroviride IMI 206040]|uniref:Uncharacterized protein n=1 Tax=Hypocrea atroviridis (strain ATCC 20476 / IMI 206040) TaxID=452589 RepID=G9P229_HYPAI|nr:uncharacterized protein TRIATDRAFT_320006 [Trichoderma atroviride IMI 206040]EHK42624.1 hypothetical protein TRIATDRAFT_320006 [Trichoderma atroviride IMI 206040]
MYASKVVASLGLFLGLATAAINLGKDSAGDTVLSTPATPEEIAQITQWSKEDNKAMVMIMSAVHTDIVMLVTTAASAYQAWKTFTLNKGFTYYLAGCGGGGLSLFNNDNSFNSNCQFQPQSLQCGVKEQWSCF